MKIINEESEKIIKFGNALAGIPADEIQITFDELNKLTNVGTIDYINTVLSSRLNKGGKITIQFERRMPEKQKRYHLEIPEKIETSDPTLMKKALTLLDFTEVEEDDTFSNFGLAFSFSNIPKEWLVEIKEDKPITAEEWMLSKYKAYEVHRDHMSGLEVCDVIEGFKAGERNETLKHRETESFEEWDDKNARWLNENSVGVDEARFLWKIALKSRGYE